MRRAEVIGAWLLLGVSFAHLASKIPLGTLPEALWVCNVLAPTLAISMLLEWRRAASTAFLFLLVVGLPAYALQVATVGTTWTSILEHVVAPVVGALYIRRVGLWTGAGIAGVGVFATLVLLARYTTPTDLNVNLSQRPWGPFHGLGWWPYFGLNLLGHLLLLLPSAHFMAKRT